jgi:sodium-coupled neutral amino acid transporter 11
MDLLEISLALLYFFIFLVTPRTEASPPPPLAFSERTVRKPSPSLASMDSLRGGGSGGGSRIDKSRRKKTLKQQDSSSGSSSATILSSVFNLVNNVAGAGILTLSSGMASGTGWIPAVIICAVLGLLSGHCFAMVGEACELLQQEDFKGLWKTTISADSAYVVDAIIAVMCLACAIIYSGILGDVFTPLLAQAGFPARYNGRSGNIVAITVGLLLPLSLIKDLSALAFTSILGFSAIIYTVAFIIVRSLDGSYSLPDGRFLQQGVIAAMPAFEKTSLWNFDFTSLVLASNLGLAYIAHYNAPVSTGQELDNVCLSFLTLFPASFCRTFIDRSKIPTHLASDSW